MPLPLGRAAARGLPALAALAALGAAALLAGCATTSVRQRADFAARRGGIAAVALVPAHVEATRAETGGARSALAEPAARVSERLPELLAAALEARGFVALELRLDAEAEGSALRRACVALERSHASAGARLWSEVEMSEDDAFAIDASLGPDARALAEPLGADAVLLARYAAFDDAGADADDDDAANELLEAALGRARPPAGPLRGSLLEVALADGRSGEILWANAAARGDPSERALESLVAAVFAGFPATAPEGAAP
jgi:hypothetical protein